MMERGNVYYAKIEFAGGACYCFELEFPSRLVFSYVCII
jgi:hypothetical protein